MTTSYTVRDLLAFCPDMVKVQGGTDVLDVFKAISAVLSSPPVNTRSIPELAAKSEERIAYPVNSINKVCTALLSLLFQVGQQVSYKQDESPHADVPAAFHCIRKLSEGNCKSGLKQLFQPPLIFFSVMFSHQQK